MDDIVGFQVACAGLNRRPNASGADGVAFGLNGRAPFGADGPGDAAAENEGFVSGIDDGLGIGLGDIPFDQFQSRVIDFDLYQKSLPANLPVLGLNRHLIFFHIGAASFGVVLVVLVECLKQLQDL